MKNDERVLNAIITNFREENNISEGKLAFDYFTVSQIIKHAEIDFVDIDDCLVDGGADGGIDCIGIFADNKLIHSIEELNEFEINQKTDLDIYIIQNKESNSFKESVFDKLIPTFRDIFEYDLIKKELAKTYNPSLVEKIVLLRESLDKVMLHSNNIKLNIIYACKGDTKEISDGVKHKKNTLESVIKERITIPNINISIFGASELRSLYVDRVEDELILKYESQMSFESEDGKNHGYIATVNLKKYFDFITKDKKIRENLLESNIRHFQGNVIVNRGMSETLIKNKDLEFWWLNNGITVLVSVTVKLVDVILFKNFFACTDWY